MEDEWWGVVGIVLALVVIVVSVMAERGMS